LVLAVANHIFPKALPLGYVRMPLQGVYLCANLINYRKCGKVEDLAITQPNATRWGNVNKLKIQKFLKIKDFHQNTVFPQK